jgi:hypothetical protein
MQHIRNNALNIQTNSKQRRNTSASLIPARYYLVDTKLSSHNNSRAVRLLVATWKALRNNAGCSLISHLDCKGASLNVCELKVMKLLRESQMLLLSNRMKPFIPYQNISIHHAIKISNWRPSSHNRPETTCNQDKKLFVNLFLVNKRVFILIPKYLKKS